MNEKAPELAPDVQIMLGIELMIDAKIDIARLNATILPDGERPNEVYMARTRASKNADIGRKMLLSGLNRITRPPVWVEGG